MYEIKLNGERVRIVPDLVDVATHKGYTIEPYSPPAPPEPQPPAPPTLSEVKAAAIRRINAEAGDLRAQHVTVTIGQEGTYLEKAREARAFQADASPSPVAYPYLSAEATHTGMTMAEVAQLVTTTEAAWTAINAEIEGRRRGALVAVDRADDVAEVGAVFPIRWED
ncbi:MAG TPA: hypothetical protein VD860_17080 [Azospirillum sp.]|nr:hypothetical protein [Azospirillum sp.]